MRRVELGTEDHMMPTGVPAASRQNKQLLQLRKRNRLVAGLVGQNAIWDLCAHKEATRPATEQGLH